MRLERYAVDSKQVLPLGHTEKVTGMILGPENDDQVRMTGLLFVCACSVGQRQRCSGFGPMCLAALLLPVSCRDTQGRGKGAENEEIDSSLLFPLLHVPSHSWPATMKVT